MSDGFFTMDQQPHQIPPPDPSKDFRPGQQDIQPSSGDKLSWEETYLAMAAQPEDWSDWEIVDVEHWPPEDTDDQAGQ